jgi:signal transduction histidine kinase
MTIRARIRRWQMVAAAAAIAVAGAGLHAVLAARDQHAALARANRQLAAATALKASANRFSEQIAEYLLVGAPERADYDSARAELEAALDRFEASSIAEDRDGELEDAHRLERMRRLYHLVSAATAEAAALRADGRLEEAIALFRRDIEDRLDAEFETLLTSAVLDEAEEVGRAERRAEALWPRLVGLLLLAALGAAALCLLGGVVLSRGLVRPIRSLTDGAESIARGRLDHRIPYDGRDELGLLARRMNEMAAVQEEQRSLLLNARTELERQVAERTAELEAANRRLTELDRLRVRFLAEIGHELRTPLTALRGEAEITLRHDGKAEAVYRDTLERIVGHAAGMARVVDDLLLLTRSEADTLRFEMRSVVLQEVLQAAARDATALGRPEAVTVAAALPEAPVAVQADPRRLRQALTIVLGHAVARSPHGGSVALEMRAEAGEAVVVVRDAGAAVPAEEMPHVFDRFHLGTGGRLSGEQGGTLNLAMAKWLVEKHGGRIAIAPVAAGMEVRLRLPLG